eukprot:m.49268 g.49268  ORF g.49268 m.49268 type:complete len:51 (-) comp15310_c0_seq2:227-379(-)
MHFSIFEITSRGTDCNRTRADDVSVGTAAIPKKPAMLLHNRCMFDGNAYA